MMVDGGELTTDALFQILGNYRRRFIIRHLYRENRAVDLKELAGLIAAEEEGSTPEAVTDEERQRVYVSLYQTHLPTLTDSGLAEYDDDTRTLRLNRAALEEHCIQPKDDLFFVGYVVVAVASLLASLGLWAGVVSAQPQTGMVLLLLFSLVLAALVGAQYVTGQRHDSQKCLLSLVD